MNKLKKKILNFPKTPGVYIFRDAKKEILYIGKATNLRSRVQSYFRDGEAGRLIGKMMYKVLDVKFQQTDSVLEALILESNLIKKYQPRYNIDLKDDKSFAYFVITKEEFPMVLIVRKTDLNLIQESKIKNSKLILNSKFEIQNSGVYGPYTSKKQMETALKIIRKIFPFHSMKSKSEKGCLDFQLGRCPGPYNGAISKDDYKKNIRGIKMILGGKKKRLITTLKNEMLEAAKNNEFEKAAEIRNKIFALNHIRDVALLNNEFNTKLQVTNYKLPVFRIEAYDISNTSGKDAVGSMVVFSGNEPIKSEYRKFKIKMTEGIGDVAMMREVLARRIGNEWPKPDLVLLDGGQGHLNMASNLFKTLDFDVPLVSIAKGPTRKKQDVRIANKNIFREELLKLLEDEKLIKYIIDEAHRFAIAFHRKKRTEKMIDRWG